MFNYGEEKHKTDRVQEDRKETRKDKQRSQNSGKYLVSIMCHIRILIHFEGFMFCLPQIVGQEQILFSM